MTTVLLVALAGLLGAVVLGGCVASPGCNRTIAIIATDRFRPFQ